MNQQTTQTRPLVAAVSTLTEIYQHCYVQQEIKHLYVIKNDLFSGSFQAKVHLLLAL